jgi:hypothetical protein
MAAEERISGEELEQPSGTFERGKEARKERRWRAIYSWADVGRGLGFWSRGGDQRLRPKVGGESDGWGHPISERRRGEAYRFGERLRWAVGCLRGWAERFPAALS